MPSVLRRVLLAVVIVALLAYAWGAVAGALAQLPRAESHVQRLETGVQLASGVLALLVVVTAFCCRRWRDGVRAAWGASLATAAGLSALAWGPPMPWLAIFFFLLGIGVAALVSLALRATTDR